jgi:hypothetical protein
MGHGRDKPKRETRKPKKEKLTVQKSGRESEVLQHVAQHPQNPDQNRS